MLEQLANDKFQFRPYQDRIVTKAFNYLTVESLSSLFIESATGSGKTAMALGLIKLLQTHSPKLAVTWTAMRRNLLSQTEAENQNMGFNNRIEFISMFQETGLPPTDLLIVDEGHHSSTTSCAHLFNVLKPRWSVLLSGTPFRSDRVKICFDKIIKDAGIGQLIRENYLSPYNHYNIPVWSVDEVCDTYTNRGNWGKSLIFFHRTEDCFKAREILNNRGINCDVVTGDSDRETQLEEFKHGKTQVLLNCMVLTEGFDMDSLETVFCRPSWKGLTIQMCGRAFRKHPRIKAKNIIQCEKTRWPFLRTAIPIKSSKWENNRWISITGNNNVEVVSMDLVTTLATIKTEMPKYITAKKKPRRRNIRLTGL